MCNGIKEKSVTLDIGVKVARLLKKNGFHVLMTRKQDMTLSVEQRVHNVNAAHTADLLVSVHANSGGPQARGLETYCIDKGCFFWPSTSLDSLGNSYIGECDDIRYAQGKSLARAIHAQVLEQTNARDRGVRHAVTRLLLGVDIPAVLVETGYLSDKDESLMLTRNEYQEKIARGIFHGICEYLNKY